MMKMPQRESEAETALLSISNHQQYCFSLAFFLYTKHFSGHIKKHIFPIFVDTKTFGYNVITHVEYLYVRIYIELQPVSPNLNS